MTTSPNWPANFAIGLYAVACKREWDEGRAPAQQPAPAAPRKPGKLSKAAIERALHGRSFRRK